MTGSRPLTRNEAAVYMTDGGDVTYAKTSLALDGALDHAQGHRHYKVGDVDTLDHDERERRA